MSPLGRQVGRRVVLVWAAGSHRRATTPGCLSLRRLARNLCLTARCRQGWGGSPLNEAAASTVCSQPCVRGADEIGDWEIVLLSPSESNGRRPGSRPRDPPWPAVARPAHSCVRALRRANHGPSPFPPKRAQPQPRRVLAVVVVLLYSRVRRSTVVFWLSFSFSLPIPSSFFLFFFCSKVRALQRTKTKKSTATPSAVRFG